MNNSVGDIKVGPNQNPNNSFSGPSGGNRNNIFPPNKIAGQNNNGNSPAMNNNNNSNPGMNSINGNNPFANAT